jgi:hypothetical protein
MATDQKPASWWQTLPGMLTAAAAVVTAVGGLVLALSQAGFFTRTNAAPSQPVQSAASIARETATRERGSLTTLPAPESTTAGAPAASAGSWADAKAVLFDRDGSTTEVSAPTFSNCISVSHSITLTNGQDVPFEQMERFEVLETLANGTPNATAKLRITLVSGQTLEGRTMANCDLAGSNEIGRFTTTFQRLTRVEFRR